MGINCRRQINTLESFGEVASTFQGGGQAKTRLCRRNKADRRASAVNFRADDFRASAQPARGFGFVKNAA